MIFRRIGRRPTKDIGIMTRLFTAAEHIALADGLDSVGAEHLLLAALDLDNDDSARRALETIGADPDHLAAAVRAQHTTALEAVGVTPLPDRSLDRHLPEPTEPGRPLKTGASAQKLFRKVVKQVRSDRSQLYGAYFVLFAAREAHGSAIRAIQHLDIDPVALEASAQNEIDERNRALRR